MSRKWLLLGLLALSLIACPRRGAKNADASPSSPLPEVWQQVPEGVFFVVGANRPAESAAGLKELVNKMGLWEGFYRELDLDDFEREFGFDLFEAGAATKIGVDPSKGVVFALDDEPTRMRIWQHYSSRSSGDASIMLEVRRDPTPFVVVALSDPKVFESWLRGQLTKEKKDITFEEGKIGDARVLYAMRMQDPARDYLLQKATPTKQLESAIVLRGTYAYLFVENVRSVGIKGAPDAVGAFQQGITSFVKRLSSPITKSPLFIEVGQRLNLAGDGLFFVDMQGFAKAYKDSIGGEEILSINELGEVKKEPNEQNTYRQKEIDLINKMAAVVPVAGMTAQLGKDRATCEGYAKVGEPYQAALSAVVDSSGNPPSYATIFPEGTDFVYRQTVRPSAVKDLLKLFLSPEDQKEMERNLQYGNNATMIFGLDLEKDILGAFTGHVAFGANSAELFTLLIGERNGLPEMTMVAQLTSPEAGDKLIQPIINLADMGGLPMKISDYQGEKLYSVTVESVTVSWARVNDLLVVSATPEALQKAVARIKSPGASFAQKLSPLTQSLLTEKSAHGCSADVGSFFSYMAKQPYTSESERATLSKVGSVLGGSTMKLTYEKGVLSCRGEVLLK